MTDYDTFGEAIKRGEEEADERRLEEFAGRDRKRLLVFFAAAGLAVVAWYEWPAAMLLIGRLVNR